MGITVSIWMWSRSGFLSFTGSAFFWSL